MSNFELWIKGCEINHSLLYCLEGSGDTAIYKVTREYMVNHRIYYDKAPVFMVWVAGKQLAATTNYQSAIACWQNHRHEVDREAAV